MHLYTTVVGYIRQGVQPTTHRGMWNLAAAILVAVVAAEYTEVCDPTDNGKTCTLCGTPDRGVSSTAPRGGIVKICEDDTGLDLQGHTLLLTQGQTLRGGGGPVEGNVKISSPDITVQNVDISGRLTISGKNCTGTVINEAMIHRGVVVIPAGPGAVNIDGSQFKNITTAPSAGNDKLIALSIAHATGAIAVVCEPGTSVLVQPAAHTSFEPAYTGCERVIDLGVLFNVFGEDLERIIFDDVPPPESRFLKTYITLAAGVTVVAFLLRA